MKLYHFLFCLLIIPFLGNCSEIKPVATTEHYEFYNNFWINQHHFLYKMAEWVKKAQLDTPSDDEVFKKLQEREKKIVNECIQFYLDQVIDKNLLFSKEMYELKRTLINFSEQDQLTNDSIAARQIEVLHAFRPVYKAHFWEKHSRRNLEVVNNNLERIKRFENRVFDRLAQLSQSQWPDGKIRVDLTYYADWAGAYTSNRPTTHAVISTETEGPEGDWVETVFHESAHSLIHANRGTVAELIKKSALALDKDPPRGLWHSIQFYFVGRVVQDLLKAEGVEYKQYMVREDVFSRHYPALAEILEPYVMGEGTLEEAVWGLVERL